jgi:hypothetical protein
LFIVFKGIFAKKGSLMTTISNIRYVSAGEICVITTIAGIVIEMFRSGKYIGPRENLEGFRPAKVIKNGEMVWSFQTCGAISPQFGELIEYENEHVIVIRDKRSIASIVRVSDFAHSAAVMLKGKQVLIGGSSVEALLDIKDTIAHELDLEYWKSPEESEILQKRVTAAREALRLLAATQQAEKEATQARREEARRLILSRNKVEAWSPLGKHFFGIPVMNDEEWKCLPRGTFCITMQNGTPTQAFIVAKEHSRVSKANQTEVSATKPAQKEVFQANSAPEMLDSINVAIRGKVETVLVFEERTVLDTFKKQGLNSKTMIGILPKNSMFMDVYVFEDGKYTPYSQVKRATVAEQLDA